MSLADVAVVLISKFPAPGKVKTRLTSAFTPKQAADVHRAFLLHLVRRLRTLMPAELFVYFDPPDARDAMADLLAEHAPIKLIPQVPGDLGMRLAHVASVVGQTHRRMLILAVDSPDVPIAHIRLAAQLAATSDVSIGPADDGGYWYLGLSNKVDAAALLHTGIDWSTATTAAQTLTNARTMHYRVAMGGRWDDVDRPEDLRTLMKRLHTSSDADDRELLNVLLQICEG